MNSPWMQVWNSIGPDLTPRLVDSSIPKLHFRSSFGDGLCGLSADGSYILFPLFLGFNPNPSFAAIPLPEVIDMVFFEKIAMFLARIRVKLRGLVRTQGPISWDHTGFLEHIIGRNRAHIARVNGFNEIIMNRIREYLDVVLNDWNGDRSSGRVSHLTFFTDESIDDELLDELVNHQTTLGQAVVMFDNNELE